MKLMQVKQAKKQHFFSMLLTIAILFTLLFIGPAQAVTLTVNAPSSATEDTETTFTVTIDLDDPREALPNNANFTLTMDSESCTFYLDNLTCSGISGVSAVAISSTGSVYGQGVAFLTGYGYDYPTGYGNFSYNYSATGYGYGYDASSSGEVVLQVTWTPTSAQADDGSIDISFAINTPAGDRFETQTSDTVTVAEKTTTTTTSSNTGSSTTYFQSTQQTNNNPPATTTPTPNQLALSTNDLSALGVTSATDVVIKPVKTVTDTVKVTPQLISEIISSPETTPATKKVLEEIQQKIDAGENVEFEMQRTVEVNELSNKDDSSKKLFKSEVKLSFTAPTRMVDVKIVEVIPKSVAADVSDIYFPGAIPTIIERDPVVEWNFDVIEAGETKDLSYIVDKQLDEVPSKTLTSAANAPQEVMEEAQETPVVEDAPTNDAPIGVPEESNLNWIFAVLALAVVGVLVFFVIKARNP